MEYRVFIPWILIIAAVVLITLIVLGVVAVTRKRQRTETPQDTGYDGGAYYNNLNPCSGEVPRNYCPYCGIRLYKDSSYCANCGRSVDKMSR